MKYYILLHNLEACPVRIKYFNSFVRLMARDSISFTAYSVITLIVKPISRNLSISLRTIPIEHRVQLFHDDSKLEMTEVDNRFSIDQEFKWKNVSRSLTPINSRIPSVGYMDPSFSAF